MHLTEAIVLKRIPIGEADGLYVLYTKEMGKVRAYAQGVAKEEAKLRSHLEPLTHAVVGFVAGKYGFRVVYAGGGKSGKAMRGSFEKMSVGWQMARVVDAHCMEEDPDEELWNMVSALFDELGAAPDTRAAAAGVVERFEKELSRRLGYGDDVSAVRMARPFVLG